jgi:hypothetical protein
MKIILVVLLALLPFSAAAKTVLPKPYKDGCSAGLSWFYRNVLNEVPRWESCCDIHDKAYGPGGTSDQRAGADRALYACVKAKGYPVTASAMWLGAVLGGQPFFPFDWSKLKIDYSAAWWYGRAGAE